MNDQLAMFADPVQHHAMRNVSPRCHAVIVELRKLGWIIWPGLKKPGTHRCWPPYAKRHGAGRGRPLILGIDELQAFLTHTVCDPIRKQLHTPDDNRRPSPIVG
jgi:hypothetical protein